MRKFLIRILLLFSILMFSLCFLLGCTQPDLFATPFVEAIPSITALPSTITTITPPLLPISTTTSTQPPFSFPTLSGKIVFANQGLDPENGSVYHGIGIVAPSGQDVQYLKKALGNELFFYPTWSPDGIYVAYVSVEIAYSRESIYIVNIKSDQTDLIRTSSKSISGLSWSPDGEKIAYSDNNGGQSDIFMIDIATKAVKQFTSSTLSEEYPSWSPDGKHIAYLQFDPLNYGDGAYIIVADIFDNSYIKLEEIRAGPSRVSWSPNGKQIAFRSNEGCGDIFVIDPDEGSFRHITTLPGGERDPAWSPDGEYIAFVRSSFDCDLSGGGEPIYSGWQPYLIRLLDKELIRMPLANDRNILNLDWFP